MSEKSFKPAQVFHPSEMIADEAMERGWGIWELVFRGGATVKDSPVKVLGWQLYSVCHHGIHMGDEGAAELERAFGIDARIWLQMEAYWNENAERHSPLEQKHEDWYEKGGDFAAPTHRIEAGSDATAADALLATLPAHIPAKRSWWSRLKSVFGASHGHPK